MNDALPPASPVRRVQPAPAMADRAPQSDDKRALSHAAYAQLRQDIADVVADLGTLEPRADPAGIDAAEHSLLSLLPQPLVVLPLPPANEHMASFVAQVTQSVARQAALARAAHGGVTKEMTIAAV
ncbi:MAG: hypothetical protein ABW184_18040 [Sphingobium sp.]